MGLRLPAFGGCTLLVYLRGQPPAPVRLETALQCRSGDIFPCLEVSPGNDFVCFYWAENRCRTSPMNCLLTVCCCSGQFLHREGRGRALRLPNNIWWTCASVLDLPAPLLGGPISNCPNPDVLRTVSVCVGLEAHLSSLGGTHPDRLQEHGTAGERALEHRD